MTHVVLQKVRGVLVPCDEESERFVASLPNGDGIGFDVKIARNVKNHRRFMALLRLGFDAWDPVVPEDTVGIVKSFEAFRKNILILAMHCDEVFEIQADGTCVVRLEARSISFRQLGDELAFKELYGRVLTVMWEKVLRWVNYKSQEEVDAVVAELLRFD